MKNPESKPRRWWNRRTKYLAWIAVGVLVPVCYLAWHIFGWPAPIRISYETTRLTSPLTAEGYVDYLRAYRESLPPDVGDYRDDPWFALMENERDLKRMPTDPARDRHQPPGTENIVYRDPVDAFTESLGEEESTIEGYEKIHDFVERVLPKRTCVPFSRADDPFLASVIDENEVWYEAFVNAYRPTSLPLKFPDASEPRLSRPLGFIALVVHQHGPEWADRFQLRSMYRAGQDDLNGALDDLTFTWKLSTRLDDMGVIGTLMAIAIEQNATQAILMEILMANRLTPEFGSKIEDLPLDSTLPTLIKQLNQFERYVYPDMILALHEAGNNAASWQDLVGIKFTGPLSELNVRRFRNSVNWNQVLIRHNQLFDRLLEAARLSGWSKQLAAFSNLEKDPACVSTDMSYNVDSSFPWTLGNPTFMLEQRSHDAVTSYVRYIKFAHLRDLRRRVVQIAARLARWRQMHGKFPDDLPSILTVDGFSVASPSLLVDPFNELQLGYEKQANGFVLYSVGPNMQNDGSGFEECSISETNFGDQNRPDDDHIWRWPPAE